MLQQVLAGRVSRFFPASARVDHWLVSSDVVPAGDVLGRRSRISPGYLPQLMSRARCPSPMVRRRHQRVLGLSDFDTLFVIEREDG